jgi:RNA polymerase sigma factor (sigma-70 family)
LAAGITARSSGGVGVRGGSRARTVAIVLDVRAVLTQLTERQRAAVVLRYVADLALAEIAAVMGYATGTVKATLHQALDHLRVELEASDDAD